MILTERKVRYEIIGILEAKTKEEVILKLKKIKDYLKINIKKTIKSITIDNGTEFAGFLEIIKKKKQNYIFVIHMPHVKKAQMKK